MRSKELALLAAGAAAGWACFGRIGVSPVRAEAAGSGGASVVVTPLASGEGETIGVLDHAQKTFAVYSHDVRRGGKLRLSAVRRFAADLQLSEYNNDAPAVGEIERLTRTR